MADDSTLDTTSVTARSLRTPHSAAVAGIVFAGLSFVFMTMLQTAIPPDPTADARWLIDDDDQVTAAIAVVPFAAIAFLWFIGVLRDLLGRREDQFFGTVFLGSGLLFLGGLFVWVGAIAATLASARARPGEFASSSAYVFAGSFVKVMGADIILRMAGVFMFSSATMWWKTQALPRWLIMISHLAAVTLLLGGPALGPLRMTFPLWVLIVSVTILATHRKTTAAAN